MWEFVIAVVVIWIVIKLTSVKKNIESNEEIGKEVRYIAIEELGVPETIYNQLVIRHMNEMRAEAVRMQSFSPYRHYSWSRVLAHSIYERYQRDFMGVLPSWFNQKDQ